MMELGDKDVIVVFNFEVIVDDFRIFGWGFVLYIYV